MVTVAKSFDAPVKLLFPRNLLSSLQMDSKYEFSMLGLGDIVIPGEYFTTPSPLLLLVLLIYLSIIHRSPLLTTTTQQVSSLRYCSDLTLTDRNTRRTSHQFISGYVSQVIS
jgi:hypothetical protein